MYNVLPYMFMLYYNTEHSHMFQPTRDHHQGKDKVKVKFSLEQAMKVQRGSRGIALLFL
jgi:hypothetical protein